MKRDTEIICTIPTVKLRGLVRKLEKLNRRANNLGVDNLVYSISKPYMTTVSRYILETESQHEEHRSFEVEVADLTMTKSMISLNGWSFLASIDYDGNNSIIFPIRHDIKIPEKYRSIGCICEHCKSNRLRKKLYLVYNEKSGEITQVGSTCIESYLGFDATVLVLHAQLMNDILILRDWSEHDFEPHGFNADPVVDLIPFMRYSVSTIRKDGYVSSSAVRESSPYENVQTSGQWVWKLLNDFSSYFKDVIGDYLPTENDIELANEIIEWIKNHEKSDNYFLNLGSLIERGYVNYKTANLACSAVAVYKKEMEQESKRKNNLENSSHFGTVSIRQNVVLHLDSVRTIDSPFGSKWLHKFHTPEGNVAIWWSTSEELKPNKIYVGKATVKAHDEYKGVKQTILSRCKLSQYTEA